MRFERTTGLLMLAATIGVGQAVAQAPSAPAPRAVPHPPAKAVDAGAATKVLDGLVGHFKTNVHMQPTLDPVLHPDLQGSAEGKAVLGGRFIQLTETGTVNNAPSESMYLFGFDPVINKYTVVRLDSTSPASIVYTGGYDAAKKEIGFEAHFSEQMSHKFTISRLTLTFVDDTFVLDESVTHAMGGSFVKVKSTTYKR